ncbi:MAG: homoserine kinase [Chitinophagaceae bacterium]|nr:homoserine kinase [Chitinophagaceae bacterium]
MSSVIIKSPATIANIVCGFDVLGLALCEPYDIMKLELTDEPGVHICMEGSFELPLNPHQNVAGVTLLSLLEKTESVKGFRLTIDKKIKPGSGIGSSAASAAGAAYAANLLLGNPFSRNELIQFAMNGEKLASGVKHADNIAPCLMGGITLIRSIFPLDIVPLPAPELFITIVHPQIEVKTSDAREILKKQILLKDAIKQWGNIAGLVAGLYEKDYALIARSLEDVIVEPVRSILIPEFQKLKSKALEAGALGGGIAGSGPSVFMLSREKSTAETVKQAMQEILDKIHISYHSYVTTINRKGVEIL